MSRASDFLLAQYQLRRNKNARYSQGAFSRLLGINSGRLAQYFSGKRFITKSAAIKMAEKLALEPDQKEYFLHLCEIDKKGKKTPEPQRIADDQMALLVEWHHLAVFYLMFTTDFKNNTAWMAERLNIPEELVASSLERLKRVGMLKHREDGTPEPQRGPFSSLPTIQNSYLQMSHKDTLKHVVSNLSDIPVEKRDISSITVAIDDSKIAEAKEMIRSFRRKLAGFVSEGKRNQVYTINVQLFPLTSVKNAPEHPSTQ